MKKSLKILLAGVLLLASCTHSTSLSPFHSDATVRLEIDGVKVFTFSEAVCQLSYNEQRHIFRAMTDTALDYFEITLSDIPRTAGTKVQAQIVWSSGTEKKSRNDVTLEATAIKGDLIWLCDGSRHTAAVVRVLK